MNFNAFLEAGPAIQIHMVAAIAALILGSFVLWRRKGGAIHKLNGRIWAVLMMITAFSGFFIHEIRLWGAFSPIHIFSVVVPVSLVWAVYAIRNGMVREHQMAMKGTYFGLLAAGAFTLLPGRVPFEMLFGQGETGWDLPFGWMVPIAIAIGIAVLVSRSAPAR